MKTQNTYCDVNKEQSNWLAICALNFFDCTIYCDKWFAYLVITIDVLTWSNDHDVVSTTLSNSKIGCYLSYYVLDSFFSLSIRLKFRISCTLSNLMSACSDSGSQRFGGCQRCSINCLAWIFKHMLVLDATNCYC